MTSQCTRARRGLQVVTTLTVLLFGSSQALAQAPAPAPAPPAAAPKTTTAPGTQRPAAAPKAPPAPNERTLGDEIPLGVEGPAGTDPSAPPTEGPQPPPDAPPTDVSAPPVEPETPPQPETPPEPAPETVAPAPPPSNANFGTDVLVKDEAQAKELRRKGAAIMITGGVVTIAGAITSIAFTIRGKQFDSLLIGSEEEYNRADCSSKVNVKEGSKCDLLSKRIASQNESIEFDDRATRAAGAAIAVGVVVTVVGGIIYRLGVKKLRGGELSRVQMQPAMGRNFGGLMLTGRF